MTKSFLVTLTVFLGICSLAAATSTFKNPNEDVVLFYNIFKDWITQTNKQYGIEEMATRFHNWKSNFDHVQEHNAKKGMSYKLEMNEFADMSSEEFSALHLGFNTALLEANKKNTNYNNNRNKTFTPKHKNATNTTHAATNATHPAANSSAALGLPNSVDWRKSNAVTSVKNQAKCGGCWSFSAAGALEGLNAIKNKKLVDLSTQQMIDCSQFFGNQGCDGGLMTTAFQFTEYYGIESEADYPFTGENDDCAQDTDKVVFKNTGYEEVTANDTVALKKAVAVQPVSVGLEASSLTVQLFKSGVISTGCTTNLDHGVLVVGYDVDKNGQEYWIVKNSWGPKWGDNGYFHIATGNQNSGMGMCGINMMASYPTL